MVSLSNCVTNCSASLHFCSEGEQKAERERTHRSFDFMRKREFSERHTASSKGSFVVSAVDHVACPTIGKKVFFAYIPEDTLSCAKAYFFMKGVETFCRST